MNNLPLVPPIFTDEELATLTDVARRVHPTAVVSNLGRRRLRIRSGNSTIILGLSDDEDLMRLSNEFLRALKDGT